jgi:hypothetical protein
MDSVAVRRRIAEVIIEEVAKHDLAWASTAREEYDGMPPEAGCDDWDRLLEGLWEGVDDELLPMIEARTKDL